MKSPVLMSWSGGKDSALALFELLRDDRYEVVGLLTSVSAEFRRISHHGVREDLLDAQATALGLPLEKVYLPSTPGGNCSNDVYERVLAEALVRWRDRGVRTVSHGDLFLEDIRAYRERLLGGLGMRGVFPLWKRDTAQVGREVVKLGFKSYLTCVEGAVGARFAGRLYDEQLLDELPPDVDPCGENGEFHSFVYDGPIFRQAVSLVRGETVTRDGRHYADLLPGAAPGPPFAGGPPLPFLSAT